jgi:hypothetical protein
MAEMQSLDADDANKKSIQQILRKFEAENDQLALDSDNGDDQQLDATTDSQALKTLEQRFADMDIATTDAAQIWDLLSPQEQHEFQALTKMDAWQGLDLPDYEPWWMAQVSMVTDLSSSSEDTVSDIPALPTAIPALSALTKAPPAPHLVFHLVHVLMTYAYLARQTMGDLADDLEGGSHSVACLSQAVLFSTTPAPLANLSDVCTDLRRQINHLQHSTEALDLTLLTDVEHLLTKDYAIRAVGELYQLLDYANKERKRKKISLAARKAYFFMAYANDLGQDQREVLVAAVRTECQRLQMDQDVFEKQRKVARRARDELKRQEGAKIVELV